jgi:hypothetical protein
MGFEQNGRVSADSAIGKLNAPPSYAPFARGGFVCVMLWVRELI